MCCLSLVFNVAVLCFPMLSAFVLMSCVYVWVFCVVLCCFIVLFCSCVCFMSCGLFRCLFALFVYVIAAVLLFTAVSVSVSMLSVCFLFGLVSCGLNYSFLLLCVLCFVSVVWFMLSVLLLSCLLVYFVLMFSHNVSVFVFMLRVFLFWLCVVCCFIRCFALCFVFNF